LTLDNLRHQRLVKTSDAAELLQKPESDARSALEGLTESGLVEARGGGPVSDRSAAGQSFSEAPGHAGSAGNARRPKGGVVPPQGIDIYGRVYKIYGRVYIYDRLVWYIRVGRSVRHPPIVSTRVLCSSNSSAIRITRSAAPGAMLSYSFNIEGGGRGPEKNLLTTLCRSLHPDDVPLLPLPSPLPRLSRQGQSLPSPPRVRRLRLASFAALSRSRRAAISLSVSAVAAKYQVWIRTRAPSSSSDRPCYSSRFKRIQSTVSSCPRLCRRKIAAPGSRRQT